MRRGARSPVRWRRGSLMCPRIRLTSYMITPSVENETTLDGVLKNPSRLAFLIGPEAYMFVMHLKL